MSDTELKKISAKAKRRLWLIAVIGVFICLFLPWWCFIILGVILFFGYAAAVAPDDDPAESKPGAPGGKANPEDDELAEDAPGGKANPEDDELAEDAPGVKANPEDDELAEDAPGGRANPEDDELAEDAPAAKAKPEDDELAEDAPAAKAKPEDDDKPAAADESDEDDPFAAEYRYEIVLESVDGLDADGMNKLYAWLNKIDRLVYPEIVNVAEKRKFPKLPLVLFSGLTKSESDLCLAYLPRVLLGSKSGKIKCSARMVCSNKELPDAFTIDIGTMFSSCKLKFVRVTGFVEGGDVIGDFWIATAPTLVRDVEFAKMHSGIKEKFYRTTKRYDGYECHTRLTDLIEKGEKKSFYFDYLEKKILRNKPAVTFNNLINLVSRIPTFLGCVIGFVFGLPFAIPGLMIAIWCYLQTVMMAILVLNGAGSNYAKNYLEIVKVWEFENPGSMFIARYFYNHMQWLWGGSGFFRGYYFFQNGVWMDIGKELAPPIVLIKLVLLCIPYTLIFMLPAMPLLWSIFRPFVGAASRLPAVSGNGCGRDC